ncbi:hypothetical protein [Streptomyces sp. ISL-94]|uniref:hypothetical protein n=1 Tax=Streptomyces sp. ISL-94 TaxID=2819190 RepID=UPI0027E410B0|nr:hypothetical protein [Streptomyces sp. ISL-94]
MHPTRTTTTLLLGVACAVSAVSGCVHVNPGPVQPAATPAAGVPPHHGPRGGPGAAPVIVRAPALEALESAPEGPPQPTAAASAAAPARGSAQPAAQQAPGGPVEAAPPVLDIPEPRKPSERASGRPGGRRDRPRPGAKAERELVKELPVRPADVCALGRRHGRWHPDSPEARICAGVQGN